MVHNLGGPSRPWSRTMSQTAQHNRVTRPTAVYRTRYLLAPNMGYHDALAAPALQRTVLRHHIYRKRRRQPEDADACADSTRAKPTPRTR
jgi:hypothetical protein